jgi:CRP-like cAMP-binding protein
MDIKILQMLYAPLGMGVCSAPSLSGERALVIAGGQMALKVVALVGERTDVSGKAVSNKILLIIPDTEYRRLRPDLQYVILPRHHTVHQPNQKTLFAYFPNDGLISLVVVTASGETVEAGIVGKEGIAGLSAVVGLRRNPLRDVVQIAGDGLRIPVAALQNALRYAPELHMILCRYAVLHGLQVSQTAACNRLHDAKQRLARWLLMTQDRVDSGILRITHDFLATMLGTDRPTVTLAAGRLQNRKIIEYSRGSVKILDRKKLEKSACECYGVVQQFNGELGLK